MFQTVEKASGLDFKTFQIMKEDRLMTFGGVLNSISDSSEFITFYNSFLKKIPFSAFFWEHPYLVQSRLSEDYEVTFVESSGLANAQEDLKPFEKYFTTDSVVSFENLRGDARLVVPCPLDVKTEYTHLAAFVRTASDHQLHEFWKKVGEEAIRRIGETPFWLSTSGLGVSWLHVRMDSAPKYYKTIDYK